MIIQEHFSLKQHNSFHFDIYADYFSAPQNEEEIIEVLSDIKFKDLPLFVLGAGSNVLFKSDFKGLIIKPDIQSIRLIDENEQSIWVEIGAGVDWDHFVQWSVEKGYFGIENLSLIPGNVGACPVQNIGAYGVEVMDVITQVNGIYLDTLEPFSFKNKECKFSYRNSIFKNGLKGKTIITSVQFLLHKQGILKTDYRGINEELEKLGETNLANVRKAIVHIRESKLPDPQTTGNAGSFFKNPVVDKDTAAKILAAFPEAPYYVVDNQHTKIPAAWMIDQSGWKGKAMGNVAVHDKQALVLINKTGKANGNEILTLAAEIQQSVKSKFGIEIEKEVNVI
ncbi:UDP-N-acetylmuramate dehydrogenase [Saccharicrinis fermentans]|uniref:UDP-N-acetylenolpyruvoylglucosamine reductase n=1 Tax=Saccharicrinis fermentans DSM 9555 = JCM 21142 TaxID=869213 RepID=W7Y385_9BACT|nr:UDP-N-acetylmuramate dehydrogenase [Saccharicrinis fermentans]GAF05305.1 UDP-N-acetylenolpyruvoylglucosamine reductase [Saccharicrinis fermentans DSM 9555 = JCM 21142]